jgi:hypothetical protein
MGFALSILYLVTYYLTPVTVFGPLGRFHVEEVLALLVLCFSLPALAKSFALKTAQSAALVGLTIAVGLSVLIGMRWPGGTPGAILSFVPSAFAYFLICLHGNSKKKLQIVVLMLLFVCLFVIVRGYIDLHSASVLDGAIQPQDSRGAESALWNAEHPLLLAMRNGQGQWFYRLKGLGEVGDPNDFGQLIVCTVPLMFIFWRTKKMAQNLFLVLLPVGLLLFGAYLTHSRGTIIAFMAITAVAARRRIGIIPSLLLAGGLFVAASALHFSGGREVSASEGSDRIGLWGDGLEMLKQNPLFGVGVRNFADHSSAGLTAHNSIVVCAAELGMFGLFCWSLFLLPTLRDVLSIASSAKVTEGAPIVAEEPQFPGVTRKIEALDKAEINRLGRLVLLSLVGFLVQGLFLSRALVLTLFLLGGMAEAIYEMALQRGMVAPRLPLARTLLYSAGFSVCLVIGMYIVVRVLNIMR